MPLSSGCSSPTKVNSALISPFHRTASISCGMLMYLVISVHLVRDAHQSVDRDMRTEYPLALVEEGLSIFVVVVGVENAEGDPHHLIRGGVIRQVALAALTLTHHLGVGVRSLAVDLVVDPGVVLADCQVIPRAPDLNVFGDITSPSKQGS